MSHLVQAGLWFVAGCVALLWIYPFLAAATGKTLQSETLGVVARCMRTAEVLGKEQQTSRAASRVVTQIFH